MTGPSDDLVPSEGAQPPVPAGADDVALLSAALRADLADLDTYSRVLVATIADGLPEGVIEIDRDRSLADRVAGRPGTVRTIRIHLGEETLELRAQRSTLVGTVARNVRGVAISRREVNLDEWTASFATALSRFAKQNAAARLALERLLGASG